MRGDYGALSVVSERRQRGQAMAEFVVSVAFVFLPLFVLVPTLGKLADIQHENQLAARYVTWERTVWFDNLSGENRDDFSRSGNDWEHVALRSASSVTASMQNRFFQTYSNGPIDLITSGDLGTKSPSSQWSYVQSEEPMLRDVSVNNFRELQTPGLAYGVTEFFASAIDTIKSPIDFLLRAVGNENEDLFGFPFFSSPKGYFTPEVVTRLNLKNAWGSGETVWDREDGEWTPGIESAIFQSWNGSMTARGGILSDGWSAQSVNHYKDRVDDYVPSDVFDNKFFDAVIDLVSYLEGGPAISAINKLEFGEPSIAPIPVDPDTNGVAPIECKRGICEFED